MLTLQKESRRICIVSDSHVAPLYLEEVKRELKKCKMEVMSYILPAGEENKTLEQIQGIYEYLIQQHFDRKGITVVSFRRWCDRRYDWFCGSHIFERGIDFIQIPTTLLSQVDSSIGGKTGVLLNSIKIWWELFISLFWCIPMYLS